MPNQLHTWISYCPWNLHVLEKRSCWSKTKWLMWSEIFRGMFLLESFIRCTKEPQSMPLNVDFCFGLAWLQDINLSSARAKLDSGQVPQLWWPQRQEVTFEPWRVLYAHSRDGRGNLTCRDYCPEGSTPAGLFSVCLELWLFGFGLWKTVSSKS